eukprot:10912210-Ditylum_brightwellii.AAC.1
MKNASIGRMHWGLRGEQMEFYLKKESISWIDGKKISWLERRADKSLFIEESWHPMDATSTQNGCC